MLALSKTLLAVVSLACAVLPEATAVGIPKNYLNTVKVGLDKKQTPQYSYSGLLDGSPSSVPYSDISCPSGTGGSCNSDVTSAIQGALNDYASVVNSWYQAGGPGGYGGDEGYFTGESGGVVVTVAFANPPYFYGAQAEQWLANWNSYEAAIQIADYMYNTNSIVACTELYDWLAGTGFVGDILILIGWNGQGYYDPGYLNDFYTCNGT